jgi:hypothetical protein
MAIDLTRLKEDLDLASRLRQSGPEGAHSGARRPSAVRASASDARIQDPHIQDPRINDARFKAVTGDEAIDTAAGWSETMKLS